MFTWSSVRKLAQKLSVMNGPSSAGGEMTAVWRLLAAHEKAVTFYWPGSDGAVQPVLYSVLGHTDGRLMPCLEALCQQWLRDS